MASSPGHAGNPNEDFAGAGPGFAVLLDGAGIPGTEAICRHGVAWYSHSLGATLLSRLSRQSGTDLVVALADAMDEVAGRHRHTCDLAHPSSPQSTVAVIRFDEDRVDYLVLADTFLVLDRADAGPRVITDSREVDVRRKCSSSLIGLPEGTREYERARLSAIDAFRAQRNAAGGYWIAKDDPQAATQAVTGSAPLGDLDGVALLTNGASRIVDPYHLVEWPGVMELLRASGPEALLHRIRQAEAEAGAVGALAGFRSPDDATVAYCEVAR